jgi:hypothetical protein
LSLNTEFAEHALRATVDKIVAIARGTSDDQGSPKLSLVAGRPRVPTARARSSPDLDQAVSEVRLCFKGR